MEATTVPQTQKTQKRLYRNNTGGYLGVVKLDHKGEEQGENVDPYGTVWLSDEEAVLTSRAPRRPEDNPFEEQTFVGVNEAGERQDFQMRPLVLEEDDARFVPNERYVPTGVESSGEAAPPVAHEAASAPEATAAPPSTGSESPSGATPPPAPPAAPPSVAVPPVRSEPAPPAPSAPTGLSGSTHGAESSVEERSSWVEPPEAPGRVLHGALAGSDEGAPEEAAAAAPDPTAAPPVAPAPVAGQAQAAPQTPGAEEHAARVVPSIGEETGAARPPTQAQPEGEYAQAEEVGSPDAPASEDAPLIGE